MSVPFPAAGAPILAPLDPLLEEIRLILQITPDQFERAKQSYEAIGKWLGADGSPLATLRPNIYPQGSAATRTTVRPRSHEEYDLDLVCQVIATSLDPMRLYQMVYDRLNANATYAPLLVKKNRCIRVDYRGNFHLDILPARPDVAATQAGCVLVPDRNLGSWKHSNPKGYAAWFNERASTLVKSLRASTAPLPDQGSPDGLPPLNRVVQLLKRRRDMVFEGHDHAPRSIVLATLAGQFYTGQTSLLEALMSVLLCIEEAARQTNGIMEVRNPTNVKENFSEAWDEVSYAKFLRFVREFRSELQALSQLSGMPAVVGDLSKLFGDSVAKRAVDGFAKRLETAREHGSLRYTAVGGLTVGSANGRSYPHHTFYGAE
jgi:hypothetical protein